MAIFHFDVRSVSRKAGRSSVGAWAYISGTRQVDQRTGRTYNYTRKAAEVLAKGCFGPMDWQACERAERRKDAKVARTIILALPHELNLPQQAMLVCKQARWLRDTHGVAVGWVIHAAPSDPRNRHAHLLLTTRKVDAAGQYGAKTRELDVRPESGRVLTYWRGHWTLLVNSSLIMARVPHAPVSCSSLADRGITRPPRKHLGPMRSVQQRRGYRTTATKHNAAVDEIERANEELAQIQVNLRHVSRLKRQARVRGQFKQARSRGGQRRRTTSSPVATDFAQSENQQPNNRATTPSPTDMLAIQPRSRNRR